MLEISWEKVCKLEPYKRIEKVSIGAGEMVALLGTNGAGKTTLIKEIFGMKPYPWTKVTLDGELIGYKNLHRLALGSCEHTFFGEFTLEMQREFYEMNFPNFRKERFELLTEYFKIPKRWKLKDLSVGEKNQVETIFALCQGADYIFLDEPFANNDIFHRKDFYKLLLGILEENETLVIATHLVEEVESVIGRVILIENFHVAADESVETLDDARKSVVDLMKEKYHYDEGRAATLIRRLEEKNEKED